MNWEEANLSLLLEAEERVGFVARERGRMAREIEDATAGHAIAAIGG